MLVLNNSPTAFWMGNLVNKNLEGQEIFSQVNEFLKLFFKNININFMCI